MEGIWLVLICIELARYFLNVRRACMIVSSIVHLFWILLAIYLETAQLSNHVIWVSYALPDLNNHRFGCFWADSWGISSHKRVNLNSGSLTLTSITMHGGLGKPKWMKIKGTQHLIILLKCIICLFSWPRSKVSALPLAWITWETRTYI